MGIHNNAVVGASGQQGYQISRSVRTRSSASAYFNRTLTTPTDNKIWTWSGWVKRGTLGAAQTLFSGQVDVNNWGLIAFLSGDTLSFQQADAASVTSTVTTTQVFRDSSAWYHIIVVFDSTQATAANRLKMYVNGVQITVFGTATYLGQNTASRINTAIAHQISRYISAAQYFDGYMTEVNFIDGQALTPSSFGETNDITGVWQPKKYGGTYGTNGFYLNFSDNSTAAALGTDFSGNSNTWTVNNISVTAGVTYDSMVDSPTVGSLSSNYCVLNSLNQNSVITLLAGNLSFTASNNRFTTGTFAVTSGKWYWEFYPVAGGAGGVGVGAILATTYVFGTAGFANGAGYIGVGYTNNGSKYISGTSSAYGATYGSGNVIGVALDLDSGTKTITFYKDNTSQGSINLPTSSEAWIVATDYSEAGTHSINFGQRPFTYTPPTGFVALNTQNLPEPTISNGGLYMKPVLYTGTSPTAKSVTGVGFQPDFTWIKSRVTGYGHALFDSVRGATKRLQSNTTGAEGTSATYLTSFDSDGFTVADDYGQNAPAEPYVSWNWNAGGSTVTNTDGSISAQVRANPTAGFSVVTYTGTGANATVGHGLGVAPKLIFFKNRASTNAWCVYHLSISPANFLQFDTSAQLSATTYPMFGTTPTAATSTVFSIGTNPQTNAASTFVAYCFAAVAGYSAFGSFTGNGASDGPFVYLGFRPKFFLYKKSSGTSNWWMFDSTTNTSNVVNAFLFPDLSNAEGTESWFDFNSNGVKMRDRTDVNTNGSGSTYIYMAFAENPFKNSLAR